jgi:hypothetical protein
MTSADPHDVSTDAILSVSVVSDSVRAASSENAFGVPRLRPPSFLWPFLKLLGRRCAGRARSAALPRFEGFFIVAPLF